MRGEKWKGTKEECGLGDLPEGGRREEVVTKEKLRGE